jgi:photosystem II stability/assembly factor-like uncharacterized protein
MDYIEIEQEIADMESGAAPLDHARLAGIVEDIEALLTEYAQAIGQLGAVAPSKHAIKAWRELLRRAKAL